VSVRDIGRALVQAAPRLEPFARRLYARLPSAWHDTPTTRLRAFFRTWRSVRFVQIGAFDGATGDPVRELVIHDARWTGALVEPQPNAFVRLQANYADQAGRLTFLNCAVSSERGELTLYCVPTAEIARLDLPAWVEELASADAAHIAKHAPGAAIVETRTPAITFDDAAARAGLETVDCVIMDVEGHERKIIESIDFERRAVRCLVFEHKHLSPADARAVAAILESHSFTLKRFGRDTFASR